MIYIALGALLVTLFSLNIEFRRALMMLQQNSYRIDRYGRYLRQSGEMTSVVKLLGVIILMIALTPTAPAWLALGVQSLFLLAVSIKELRRKYKKPLVMTKRVMRIFSTMTVIYAILCALFSLYQPMENYLSIWSFVGLGCWFASPWLASVAVWVLQPWEDWINRSYIADATKILTSMPSIKVIGITGSYGKTSTKHYLQCILSQKYSVCMTPGSFNTPMGVVRTIREHLRPYDEVFICEMGAKQLGDIAEICKIVHPTIGVVTAVGPQHLESFKSIENVQRTKFELIDALPSDGLAVLNNDFPMVASRRVTGVETIRYTVNPTNNSDYYATDITYTTAGTRFTLHTPDGDLALSTPLLGECNVSNLIAAAIIGLRMGVSREQLAYAVEKIEQVEHRLSVKRLPGGVTIIDDAFNSNPSGSSMALDVLAAMPSPRVIITPGMIELGNEQYELNRQFGEKIVRCCDIAIVVGNYNREAILEGIGAPEGVQVITADTFLNALTHLPKGAHTVLYENDLPDTFK